MMHFIGLVSAYGTARAGPVQRRPYGVARAPARHQRYGEAYDRQEKTAYAVRRKPFNLLPKTACKYGRSDRIRTYDPLIPNQMRYQAALRSEAGDSIAVLPARSIVP